MSTPHILTATILTHAAPSSNYRGESEDNRTKIQTIRKDGQNLPVISSEAIRNALREILRQEGLPSNRSRLHGEDQLAVRFEEFPNAEKYADDFLFGFLVMDKKACDKHKGRPSKRDSVLRMNMAVGLDAYRDEATLHQSPLFAGKSPWQNATTSALLHKEVVYTAFQYNFALPIRDCMMGHGPQWSQSLLKAIGQLTNVAGNHARSYFDMSPRSIVGRLGMGMVPGYSTYGFDHKGGFKDLERINAQDLPGSEFWVGGDIVRAMAASERHRLETEGAHLYENPQVLLEALGQAAFGVTRS